MVASQGLINGGPTGSPHKCAWVWENELNLNFPLINTLQTGSIDFRHLPCFVMFE